MYQEVVHVLDTVGIMGDLGQSSAMVAQSMEQQVLFFFILIFDALLFFSDLFPFATLLFIQSTVQVLFHEMIIFCCRTNSIELHG